MFTHPSGVLPSIENRYYYDPIASSSRLGRLSASRFRAYCGARFVSAIAVQMQTVAIGWQVYDITRDPLALGLVGLASFTPAIGLALVTGHVADRFDRR